MKSVRVLCAASLVLALAACSNGIGDDANRVAQGTAIIPATGFGCPPHGHLNAAGGVMEAHAAPFKIAIGYATNPGTICPANLTASTNDIFGAPPPRKGWSALLYVGVNFHSHPTNAQWGPAGPQEYVNVSHRNRLKAGSYCLVYFASSGSGSQTRWTRVWHARAFQSDDARRLRITGAPPYYTPLFDGPAIEFVETVFELQRASNNARC